MKVLVTGASGLVGTAVSAQLRRDSHRVIGLSRSATGTSADEWRWDPASGEMDARFAEGMDAVVHLAGENLAAGRWTEGRKALIRESRVRGTRMLVEALGRLPVKPRVAIGASATGFYGDRGEEICTETSDPGVGFLAKVCREWEATWRPLEEQGVRVVRLRIGMVLSEAGGALARVVPVFRWGLGGVLGSGRQYWSWIHLDDLVRCVGCALEHPKVAGAVNAVAPNPVTNRAFTRELASVLGRPAWLPVPGWGLRLGFGEMANEVLLSSARVVPAALQRLEFQFRYPGLRAALAAILQAG